MPKHTIKILGKGCASCVAAERLVREEVALAGADVEIEKVTNTRDMVAYGIMSTPAVVIDDRVIHVGGVPTRAEVQRWLQALRP